MHVDWRQKTVSRYAADILVIHPSRLDVKGFGNKISISGPDGNWTTEERRVGPMEVALSFA